MSTLVFGRPVEPASALIGCPAEHDAWSDRPPGRARLPRLTIQPSTAPRSTSHRKFASRTIPEIFGRVRIAPPLPSSLKLSGRSAWRRRALPYPPTPQLEPMPHPVRPASGQLGPTPSPRRPASGQLGAVPHPRRPGVGRARTCPLPSPSRLRASFDQRPSLAEQAPGQLRSRPKPARPASAQLEAARSLIDQPPGPVKRPLNPRAHPALLLGPVCISSKRALTPASGVSRTHIEDRGVWRDPIDSRKVSERGSRARRPPPAKPRC
jgi:hypothetical protein